jgi:hypothetical protein
MEGMMEGETPEKTEEQVELEGPTALELEQMETFESLKALFGITRTVEMEDRER